MFADTLIRLAREDARIVGITAAMADGTSLDLFQREFPSRFYDVGIAEQHAVTFAAGLASEGMKPVAAIYSTFLQRAYDQVVHDVCLQNLDVTFAMDRAGLVGADGATHQGMFDIAYLRTLPNMVCLAPKDENELQHMLRTAVEHPGPAAIRYPRGEGFGVPIDLDIKAIPVGEAELLRDGADVAIVAYGIARASRARGGWRARRRRHLLRGAERALREAARRGAHPVAGAQGSRTHHGRRARGDGWLRQRRARAARARRHHDPGAHARAGRSPARAGQPREAARRRGPRRAGHDERRARTARRAHLTGVELGRFSGCLLGLAVGDALGATLELCPRGSFAPIADMIGGGPHALAAGQWTDDTAMALCLAESLLACEGFDARDQMQRYVRWWQHGHWSSTGVCFDIGVTTTTALQRFSRDGEPFAGSRAPESAGNGSLMRLAPVPIFFFPDVAAAERYAAESSRTTHAAAEAVDACRLFARVLCRALAGEPKDAILHADAASFAGAPAIAAVARGAYLAKTERAIRGSGYVVESLEAALWCFAQSASFEDAVLRAANLGDDADTTAAICGQIAGAHYGEASIPAAWLAKLARRDEIAALAARLADSAPR